MAKVKSLVLMLLASASKSLSKSLQPVSFSSAKGLKLALDKGSVAVVDVNVGGTHDVLAVFGKLVVP